LNPCRDNRHPVFPKNRVLIFFGKTGNSKNCDRVLAKVLLDPPELLKDVWQGLNHISDEALMSKGRVYGGGSRESLT